MLSEVSKQKKRVYGSYCSPGDNVIPLLWPRKVAEFKRERGVDTEAGGDGKEVVPLWT